MVSPWGLRFEVYGLGLAKFVTVISVVLVVTRSGS